MLNQEQLAAHYAGIGGSSVGKVLGVDPYDSPLDYYSKIVHYMDSEKLPDDEVELLTNAEAALWGNLLENAIATEWARRNEVKVMKVSKPRWDKELPFLVANVDRLVVGQRRGLEVKNRTAFKLRDYDAGPLETELLQCAHYMGVYGATQWDLAVLVGGQKLLTFAIKRDDELISLCREACSRFWNEHVLPRKPPPPTRLADLEAYYRRGTKGLTVPASPQLIETLDALREAKARADEIEAQVLSFEFTLKGAMLDATDLVADDGSTLVTWRNNKDSEGVDYKALAEFLLNEPTLPLDADGKAALVKKFAFTKPGARVFRLPKPKTAKAEESNNVAA
jgi:predicted phage-related endonuclease